MWKEGYKRVWVSKFLGVVLFFDDEISGYYNDTKILESIVEAKISGINSS